MRQYCEAMSCTIALFTRDLRVHDNPMLGTACSADLPVHAMFVLDKQLLERDSIGPNRRAFLGECLADLDASLRARGSRLHVQSGSWVDEVMRTVTASDATELHLSADVSRFAQHRREALSEQLRAKGVALVLHDSVTAVAPGVIVPAGSNEYKVFTPYYRRWCATPRRAVLDAPASIRTTDSASTRTDPAGLHVTPADLAPHRLIGGETKARELVESWFDTGIATYAELHNDLAGDATSHLAPYLHFGCISALELVLRSESHPKGAEFARQLCWRDFFHQILAARPEVDRVDFRSRGDVWNEDPEAFRRWADGTTGYPLVDAAMRQLLREGFMHNRARMVVASFLTKDLYLDWRLGAAHFLRHLSDADVANNQLNWQWVAGTGSDTNPNRIFNPVLQSKRFDPSGAYIRRYVPELGSLTGEAIHWPGPLDREFAGYPPPMVDHGEAIAAYRLAVSSRAR